MLAMSKAPVQFPLSRLELRRSWNIVTFAGMLGITYYSFCILEVPRVRFLTELGATPFDFGVIAALASFAIVFQLVSGVWSSRMGSRKIPWMIMTIAHRVIFLGVIAAPILFMGDRARIWWIIGILFMHDTLIHLGGPMWMSWMGDLVPEKTMNRLWGGRQRLVTAVNIVSALIAAAVIGRFEGRGQVIAGYSLLAIAGVIVGVIDILLFWLIPEPPQEKTEPQPLLRTMLEPLKDKQYRPFIWFMLYWYFVMMLAAPFFTLYLIKSLGLPSFYVQCITVFNLVGVVATSNFWGRVCDSYGNRPVLQVALILKPLTILPFILVPATPSIAIPIFAVTQLFDGALNAALALSIQGIMFHASPKKNRAMYIAAINFLAVGVAGGFAPLISGWIIQKYTDFSLPFLFRELNIYNMVFLVSVGLRVVALYFAARVPSRRMTPVRVMVKQVFDLRIFRLLRLINQLESSKSKAARIRAARILARLHSPLALGALIETLEDPSRSVRRAAISGLGKIGNDEAAQYLALAIQDRNPRLQSPAVRALAKIGSLRSMQTLLDNLQALDKTALLWTIGHLAQTGDKAAILPLIRLRDRVEDAEVKKCILDALGRIQHAGPPAGVLTRAEGAGRPGPRP
jgi:MFS family permease